MLPAAARAEVERPLIPKDWAAWGGPAGTPIPVDTKTMVRYGASATPTPVLIGRKGIARFYAPVRLNEGELSRRVEELLEEPL